MINFHHTCRFSILTINLSKVWPRQIVDLGKQFNLIICLENVLTTSLQDVLKMSWRRHYDVFKTPRLLEDALKTFLEDTLTFWRRLEEVLASCIKDILKTSWRRLQNIFKTSWRCLKDVFARLLEDVLKTCLKRLKDVWPKRIYWSWSRRLEDVWRHLLKMYG